MNKYQIIFHPLAKNELLESAGWYFEKSKQAYSKFQIEISTIILLLKENPLLFPKIYNNKRKANLKRFPYSIVFSVNKEIIYVFAVFHQSRNPKIWEKR